MGSKERREREKLTTRQRILEAARELFVDSGYDDVTMRKIAERIEYSPTAIYVHFADKEALMTELSVCDFQAFTEAFERVPPNPDPVGVLRDMAAAFVAFVLEHPHQYRLLFMTPRPDPKEMAGKPEVDAYELLIRAVRTARDGGAVHPGWDPDVVAQVMWGSLHGLVALWLVLPTNGRVALRPIAELVEVATGRLLEGFSRPPPR